MEAIWRRREHELRLSPDRALGTLADAEAFLADRGLLTRMADSALPSLFAACHEEPLRAGGRGFERWPRSKWIWSFQLARHGTLITKLHRGRTLYLTSAAARVFDPLVRIEIAEASGDERRLVDHLERYGASLPADLELELGWNRRRLKRARERLQAAGALISAGLVFESPESWHFAPLQRWDSAVPEVPRPADPFEPVILLAMRAAVLAPEAELRSWFRWPIPAGTVQRLVSAGHLSRPAPDWIATGS